MISLAVCGASTFLTGCEAVVEGGGSGDPRSFARGFTDILDDRYDEVFPDDQVQTVRISMDDADWDAMQRRHREGVLPGGHLDRRRTHAGRGRSDQRQQFPYGGSLCQGASGPASRSTSTSSTLSGLPRH